MASVNRVILIGNLGGEPETRYLPDQRAVCNFSIATSEQWKGKDGEKHEATTWHRIVCYGRTAEVAGEYLRKGKSVYIEGKINIREYEKDGVKQRAFEIVCDRMQMLGGREGGEGAPARSGPNEYAAAKGGARTSSERKSPQTGDFDDDIPF